MSTAATAHAWHSSTSAILVVTPADVAATPRAREVPPPMSGCRARHA
ncbi:MAG: hypothetical protein R3F08_15030 [Dokdonella sp.]